MKKSVIAAAVAAVLAVPVVAMADVTVSGGLQAELRSVGGDGGAGTATTPLPKGLYATDGGVFGGTTTAQNGGSYGFLKFSASEDLGNGLKALAMWNGAANIGAANGGTNNGGISGRDAYVGLAGGWGAVLAGTLSTPYKSSTIGWDPFVTTSLQARGNGGMSDLQNGYVDNALAYAGDFGGVKVVAAMVLDEAPKGGTSTDTSGHNSTSFSVNAPIGPVELAVAYLDVSKNAALGYTGLDNLDAIKVGVKWASGDWTVAGQVEQLDKGFSANGKAQNAVYVTGSYAMGNNTISAAYGTANKNIGNYVLGGGIGLGITGATTKNVTYEAIGVSHAFSKTTSTFAGYASTDGGTGYKQNTLSVGLRVAF